MTAPGSIWALETLRLMAGMRKRSFSPELEGEGSFMTGNAFKVLSWCNEEMPEPRFLKFSPFQTLSQGGKKRERITLL